MKGCFVAGLEYSADVTAEVIGKPEKAFFDAALSHLNSIISRTEKDIILKKEGRVYGTILITIVWQQFYNVSFLLMLTSKMSILFYFILFQKF